MMSGHSHADAIPPHQPRLSLGASPSWRGDGVAAWDALRLPRRAAVEIMNILEVICAPSAFC